MPFKTPNKTSEYLRSLLGQETDEDLCAILQYADENTVAVLLPETAAFLKQLICIKQPLKILEIGTAIGYSGLLMLKNCDAKLYTVEMEEEKIAVARSFFTKAGMIERVRFFCGDACEIVPVMEGSFDFIFMDGPKTRYIQFYPYLKRMLDKSGVLLCDNVLFNGMVDGSGEYIPKKASIAKALDGFLHIAAEDPDMLTSVLPVGDGLSLSLRHGEKNQ